MPGVLIIEAMAQASIILYYVCKPEIAKTNPGYYLGKVKSEFFIPVLPGDKLILEIDNVKIADNAGVVDALARVGERIVAKANLVFGLKGMINRRVVVTGLGSFHLSESARMNSGNPLLKVNQE